MNAEAGLTLRLTLRNGRIAALDVESTRFDLPAVLTVGRTPADVAATIPRLFSICAHAQGAAAAAALDAARGIIVTEDVQRRREADVRREAIVELMSRLLLDWPKTLGEQPDIPTVAQLRSAPGHWSRDIALRAIYGMPPQDWLAMRLPQLADWSAQGATLAAVVLDRLVRDSATPALGVPRRLPATDAAMLREIGARMREPGYLRMPDWRGAPAETGAIARHSGEPLLRAYVDRHGVTVAARALARLVELAMLLVGSSNGPATAAGPLTHALVLQPGIGIGAAETARGLLVHRAHVDRDRVTAYSILAPTEWNFHPHGALALGLLRRAAATPDAVRRHALWLVQALDPCVACRIDVEAALPTGEVIHA